MTSFAMAIARNAASLTGSGSPTNVTTVRLVSLPGSTSMRSAPGTPRNGLEDPLDPRHVAPLGEVRHALHDPLGHADLLLNEAPSCASSAKTKNGAQPKAERRPRKSGHPMKPARDFVPWLGARTDVDALVHEVRSDTARGRKIRRDQYMPPMPPMPASGPPDGASFSSGTSQTRASVVRRCRRWNRRSGWRSGRPWPGR